MYNESLSHDNEESFYLNLIDLERNKQQNKCIHGMSNTAEAFNMKYHNHCIANIMSAYCQVLIILSGCFYINALQIDINKSDDSNINKCEYYDSKCLERAKINSTMNISECKGVEICNFTEEYVHSCQVTWAEENTTNSKTYIPSHYHPHSSGHIVYQMGCFAQLRTQMTDCRNTCVEDKTTQFAYDKRNGVLFCCCKGNMCNTNFSWIPKVPEPSFESKVEEKPSSSTILFCSILVPIISIITMSIVTYFSCKKKILYILRRQNNVLNLNPEVPSDDSETLLLRPLETIQLVEIKARGRFEVWKGAQSNNQCSVAVKVFNQIEKASWNAEKDIYKLLRTDHINILKLVAIDIIYSENAIKQYWLITEFHPRGSLYDLLAVNLLSWEDLCTIALGMACGLNYLHEEVQHGKPAIAHRDVKSKNILIKSDLTPCLADFGLALVFERGQPIGDTYPQVGTRRYMAPEVLEGAIIFSRDQFFRIDMYAFGLVLWELISRCATLWHTVNPSIVDQTHSTESYVFNRSEESTIVENYRLPFEIESGVSNPSLDQMQDLVINQRLRPQFRDDWDHHPGMRKMIRTIKECWDQDSEARISASCVMERIQAIQGCDIDPTNSSNPSQNTNHTEISIS